MPTTRRELVDYTGRLARCGKARMSSMLKDVFARLETNAEMWQHLLGRMLTSSSNLRGTFFATGANTIRVIAKERNRRIISLAPQVASESRLVSIFQPAALRSRVLMLRR